MQVIGVLSFLPRFGYASKKKHFFSAGLETAPGMVLGLAIRGQRHKLHVNCQQLKKSFHGTEGNKRALCVYVIYYIGCMYIAHTHTQGGSMLLAQKIPKALTNMLRSRILDSPSNGATLGAPGKKLGGILSSGWRITPTYKNAQSKFEFIHEFASTSC